MLELSPRQMKIVERLFGAGFRHMNIPVYENALCVRRGDCAAVLGSEKGGGLCLQAPPVWVVEGNLGARIRRGEREVFVWKKMELEATPARNAELQAFERDLLRLLQEPSGS